MKKLLNTALFPALALIGFARSVVTREDTIEKAMSSFDKARARLVSIAEAEDAKSDALLAEAEVLEEAVLLKEREADEAFARSERAHEMSLRLSRLLG